jgi:hypothetical protein
MSGHVDSQFKKATSQQFCTSAGLDSRGPAPVEGSPQVTIHQGFCVACALSPALAADVADECL